MSRPSVPAVPVRPRTCDVSIVIPVRNEAAHIDACLDSVLGQATPGLAIEVLMVDGLSDDGTREAIARRRDADPRVRLLDNPARRVSPALNVGLLASSGRVVIRMDAHSEYAPDYVASTLAVLEETGADAVGGIQVPAPGAPTAVARAIAAMQEGSFGTGGAPHRTAGYEGPANTLWLGGFARDVAERVGGFDESLFRSEDNDFYERVRATGGRVWVSARLRARYLCRPTLRSFAAQCWVTGTELAPTLRKNRRALEPRHLAPALALAVVSALAVAAAIPSAASRPAALVLALGAGSYAALAIAGAVGAAARHGIAVFAPCLAAYVVAHVSYAVGTIVGIARELSPSPRS